MALTIQKVNIAGQRWYLYKDGVKTVLSEYRDPQAGEVVSKGIYFDTPDGNLSDGQYAVQENGYVWAKIPKYAVFKMPPQYIDLENNTISDEGITYFKTYSVRE
jgi:hypothetical protein